MSNLSAIVSLDGEVISASESESEKAFEFKVLNSLDFDSVKSFYIKKTIIEAVKDKRNATNGSNGVTVAEMLTLFQWKDIEIYVKELEAKKIIKKRMGINLEMYFIPKK